jgi:hypothetical protein
MYWGDSHLSVRTSSGDIEADVKAGNILLNAKGEAKLGTPSLLLLPLFYDHILNHSFFFFFFFFFGNLF